MSYLCTQNRNTMRYEFQASRISGNWNAVFPDKLIIEDDKVTYYKGKLIGYDQSVIMRERIGSVSISQHLLFGDVVIESKGSQTIHAEGFTRSDAKQILRLLSEWFLTDKNRWVFPTRQKTSGGHFFAQIHPNFARFCSVWVAKCRKMQKNDIFL